MSNPTTLEKIASLPKILEAARTLWLWGLQAEEPAATVKRFVEAHPDINEQLGASQRRGEGR
jgi:hypothetical protein